MFGWDIRKGVYVFMNTMHEMLISSLFYDLQYGASQALDLYPKMEVVQTSSALWSCASAIHEVQRQEDAS